MPRGVDGIEARAVDFIKMWLNAHVLGTDKEIGKYAVERRIGRRRDSVPRERSSVCEIPLAQLETLGKEVPDVLCQMVRMMSREISKDKRALQFAKTSAESKLASFLPSLSRRIHERGFSACEFRLSMSRGDIGNYLGLAEETVSRLFTHFQDDGLLSVERKHVCLFDLARLQDLARGTPATGAPGGGAASKS